MRQRRAPFWLRTALVLAASLAAFTLVGWLGENASAGVAVPLFGLALLLVCRELR